MAKEDSNKKALMVKRETYTKDGETFFSYFVEGVIRGKNVKARVSPSDQGGYVLLDIIFDGKDEVELVVTPSSMVGEDGRQIEFVIYECRDVDENGQVFACKVKPQRQSDKAILEMLNQ